MPHTAAPEIDQKPRRSERVPFRLARLEERWTCSRMSVWRARQDPRFPKTFQIGSMNHVWLDELQDFEEELAATTGAGDDG